ncbi:SpoIIE family protein phosphatase [Streptomyces sp. NPDC046985]|uniref:SpoIIE family protein phosphatase n=1 Tax=Streptomyces sp. NPDC046985 TaxID=3155377 RepID=UPI0033FAF449
MNRPHRTSAAPGGALDGALYAALFADSPRPLYVLDTEQRLVGYNAAATKTPGAPALHDCLDRPFGQWARFAAPERERLEAALREVLATGASLHDTEVRADVPDAPGVVVSVASCALHDPAGRPVGLAVTVADVTDRYRNRIRLDVLRRAGERIGTSLDIVQTAQELADVTVPDFADTVIVEVLDAVLRGDAPALDSTGGDLTLRCAGRRCGSAQNESGRPDAPAEAAYAEALAQRRPLLIGGRRDDAGRSRRDADGEGAAEAGQSSMAVPLSARGVLLGLARFHREPARPPFDDDDLNVAVELARLTALCLDNARLYTRDHSVARILQRTLRPQDVPATAAVRTAHAHLPGSPGGNWFDVIPLSGARVALVVGSPPGRGIRAAVTMGGLRAAIGVLSVLDLSAEEILERVHDLVTRLDGEQAAQHDEDQDARRVGTTCLYVVYDPVTSRCTLTSAGHVPPALVHPDGRVEFARMPVGPPLGRGAPRYQTAETHLSVGSLLVLGNTLLSGCGPSGGAVRPDEEYDELGEYDNLEEYDKPEEQAECCESQEAERKRLTEAVRPHDRPLPEVCHSLLESLARQSPGSGGALLLARTRGLGADQVASWTLGNDPAAVAEARADTQRQLTAWGEDDMEFTAALVVSELVTNAVRYSEGPVRLRLIRDHALIVEVTDDSSSAPHLRHAEDDDEHGRGLHITSKLTQRWGARRERRGKTIWAELEPEPSPSSAHG